MISVKRIIMRYDGGDLTLAVDKRLESTDENSTVKSIKINAHDITIKTLDNTIIVYPKAQILSYGYKEEAK